MERYLEQFDEFFDSNMKVMIVYGTDMHEKITKVSDYIFKRFKDKTFLLRTNHIGDIEYWNLPKELDTPKKKTTNKRYYADGNNFYFESMSAKHLWGKTSESIDIAIAYTIDMIKEEDYDDFMESLYSLKDIGKIVLVSWNDESDSVNKFLRCCDAYKVVINKRK